MVSDHGKGDRVMSKVPNTVSLVNRALKTGSAGPKPTTIGETHITVPGSADLFGGYRFHGTKTFTPMGSTRLVQVGEIHDAVGGRVATVCTVDRKGVQALLVLTGSGRYWQRSYEPDQDIVEQIALVACVAINGREVQS